MKRSDALEKYIEKMEYLIIKDKLVIEFNLSQSIAQPDQLPKILENNKSFEGRIEMNRTILSFLKRKLEQEYEKE